MSNIELANMVEELGYGEEPEMDHYGCNLLLRLKFLNPYPT
tara:strand:+ start:1433 stop:1555 length:123 start_codon:yes stop_codon:yes gene_type:complete